jgi:hypothetical protein
VITKPRRFPDAFRRDRRQARPKSRETPAEGGISMTLSARRIDICGLDIDPLSPAIGAEIRGLDLARPLPPDTRAALHSALLEWKELFFRDQHIGTHQHLAFARSFGTLEIHPFAPHKPGYPEVLAITHDRESRGRENTWHSDVPWRAEPFSPPRLGRVRPLRSRTDGACLRGKGSSGRCRAPRRSRPRPASSMRRAHHISTIRRLVPAWSHPTCHGVEAIRAGGGYAFRCPESYSAGTAGGSGDVTVSCFHRANAPCMWQ